MSKKNDISDNSKAINYEPLLATVKNYNRDDVIKIIYKVLQSTGGEIKLTWKGTFAEFDGKDLDKWIESNV